MRRWSPAGTGTAMLALLSVWAQPSRAEARPPEALTLFQLADGKALPILTIDSETCDCATSGGHGCGKLQRSTAQCEPADGSDYRKVYLKILPSKANDMNEIARLEERAPGEKPAEAGVFRWDGRQYQLSPTPTAPGP